MALKWDKQESRPSVTPRFTGHHAHKLDSQGRVSLPRAWRDQLPMQCNLVLLGGEDENLTAYLKEDFQTYFGAILDMPANPFDTELTAAISAVLSVYEEVNCDRNGRLSISQELLAHLKLNDGAKDLDKTQGETLETVYFMAGQGHFEIVSPAAKRRRLDLKSAYKTIRERLAQAAEAKKTDQPGKAAAPAVNEVRQ